MTTHWWATPCGPGCATVEGCATATHEGCSTGEAHLANGRWEMDMMTHVVCTDQFGHTRSEVPHGGAFHYSWDPQTLAGTGEMTVSPDSVCHDGGRTTAGSGVVDFQLTPAI